MSKKDNKPQPSTPINTSKSMGPIGSVSGMSPMERVANIKAMQKLSPFSAINDAVKNMDLKNFGLGRFFFSQQKEQFTKILGKINDIKKKEKEYNYHVPGVTKSINGKEVVVSNLSEYNVKLRQSEDILETNNKGSFVATGWHPKHNKGVLNEKTNHPEEKGTIK